MKTTKEGAVRRQLSTLFNIGATRELTDGQLLERFSTGPSEVAELAFEALVERHGAMVLRVCRAQLADHHDTQDAFQATFLILIKKARALWIRDSLGPWLHQVAFRTASCARSDGARRRKHEGRASELQPRIGIGLAKSSPSSELERGSPCGRSTGSRSATEFLDRALRSRGLTPASGAAAADGAASVGTVKSWRFPRAAAAPRPLDPARPGSVGSDGNRNSRSTGANAAVSEEIVPQRNAGSLDSG